eukprot:95780_1
MALCDNSNFQFDVPVDIFQWILTFVNLKDLKECAQVSMFWYQYTSYCNLNNTRIWKNIWIKELMISNNLNIEQSTSNGLLYKDIYKYCKFSKHILDAISGKKFQEIVKRPKLNAPKDNTTVNMWQSIWGKKKKKNVKIKIIKNKDLISGLRIMIYFDYCIDNLNKEQCQWILMSLKQRKLQYTFKWFAKKIYYVWWGKKQYAL